MSALDDFRMSKFDELTELEHIIVMSDRDYHVRVAAAEELANLRTRIAELDAQVEDYRQKYALESGISEARLMRISELEAMTQWKPIASAPKDGSEVMGLDSSGCIGNMHWFNETDYIKGHWLIRRSGSSIMTHWMPKLPETE